MRYIKNIEKELFLIILGSSLLIIIGFFLYGSLNVVHKNISYVVQSEVNTEAKTTINNLKQFLLDNKKSIDKAFINTPFRKDLLIYYLNNFMYFSQKKYINSVYFVRKDRKILFLYPKLSNRFMDLNLIADSNKLSQKINTAKQLRSSLYFNCTVLNDKFQNIPEIMLIKPFFTSSGSYFGSIVEIVDIQKKLDDIFAYIKDYSVTVISKNIKIKKGCDAEALIPLRLDKSSFYIKVCHDIKTKDTLFKNMHDIMLNILFMIFFIFVTFVFTAVVLIKKSRKEMVQSTALNKLNKRIKMLENAISIQSGHLSKHSIRKILSMANNVFETDLSGIFLKDTNMNYVFDGYSIKEQNYLSIKGSLSSYVWENRKDMLINDFQNADFIDEKIKQTTKMKSSICAVISFKGNDYGVICVGSSKTKNAFKEEDFSFLKLIAHNIALNLYRSLLAKNISETLLNAIEARDSYTEGHSRRVGEYAKFISKVLGYDEEFQDDILTAGLFHDVGKVGIPDIILLKPTRLSPNEYEIMKLHSVFSYEILKNLETLKNVILGIRGHHERWDGEGYPDGLRGADIPVTARILAIADSFDAITTLRPYKNAMGLEQTKKELIKNAGSQFDPDMIDKIIPHLKEMYELGKKLSENKKPFFPQFVENTRKNIFYTDWFSGLMRMEYFEEIMGGLIAKDVEFFICRVDVVDFSGIKYKMGRKKASEIILFISAVLKEYVGSDAVARTSEDVFTFIVRGAEEPTDLLNEIMEKIEPKTECSLRFAYVSYPKDGKNVDELIYRLDKKHRMGGYRRDIYSDF